LGRESGASSSPDGGDEDRTTFRRRLFVGGAM
jgi:hypothetical protein